MVKSITIAGDFYIAPSLLNPNDTEIISERIDTVINGVDKKTFSIINLECPITESKVAFTKTGPSLKGSEQLLDILKSAQIDAVSLANNHILDYNDVGIIDTLEKLKTRNILSFGAGKNYQEASKTMYIAVDNLTIALLNFTENEWSTTEGEYYGANPINTVRNFYAIQEAQERADRVIVIAHGGNELYELPSPRLKRLYRFFVDAGANVVIGHHTHVVSAYEVYKQSPILYSIGNFIFKQQIEQNQHDRICGCTVQIHFGKNTSFNIRPVKTSKLSPFIEIPNEKEQEQFFEHIQELNAILVDDKALESSFDNYCKNVSKQYNSYLEPYSNRVLLALKNRGIIPSVLNKRKKRYIENIVRCEAHREVLLKTISK